MSQVLIVTNGVVPVQPTVDALRSRGWTPVVLDTQTLPDTTRLSIREDGLLVLRDDWGATVLDDLGAVWYRRASYTHGLGDDAPTELRRAVVESTKALLTGALASRDVYVLQPRWAIEHAEHKPRQLTLARACGLEVPATLCTTSADAVRAFVARHDEVITKVFGSFAVRGDEVMMTTSLTAADVAELTDEELALCPGTFQERLHTERELRVTVVGDELFVASLPGQDLKEVDWRRDGVRLASSWRRDELPAAVADGLRRLMLRLGLDFGTADVIHTTDGRWVFLEVNPAGEFLWLEHLFDDGVSEAIAALLVRGGR